MLSETFTRFDGREKKTRKKEGFFVLGNVFIGWDIIGKISGRNLNLRPISHFTLMPPVDSYDS